MSSFESSPYSIPIEDLRSSRDKISIARQRITRTEKSRLRYVRNLERQALAASASTASNRKIKSDADDMRAVITARAEQERGRLEEGIIYDSMQYDQPTNNRQGTDALASSSESSGVDSINGESAPGNSQGGAAGGVPNDNVTTDPNITPDTPVSPEDPLRTIDWYRYDVDTTDLFFGNAVNGNTRGGIKDFRIEYSGGLVFQATTTGGGFNIQDAAGNAKIRLFYADLPDNVSTAEPAKFRSIKVCLNGVPATMSVLGTKPEAS